MTDQPTPPPSERGPGFHTKLVGALPLLTRFFRQRRAGGADSPSDLTQSVVREALRARDDFEDRGERAFRSWLLLKAHSKWVARIRANSRRPTSDEDSTEVVDPTPASEPGLALEVHEDVQRLRTAIDSLPSEQRRVLVACRMEGLPRAVVAEELGKSEGAVRMILHRALTEVARILRD